MEDNPNLQALAPQGFRVFWIPDFNDGPPCPKCGAVPTPLHPDIQFLLLYHAAGENQSFSCLWSILWSTPFSGLFS